MNILNLELTTTDKEQALKLVDLRLFNNFKFRQVLNTKEVNNYAELIFKRLLNYYNKKIEDKDIIKESEYVFYSFSTRTAYEKLIKML